MYRKYQSRLFLLFALLLCMLSCEKSGVEGEGSMAGTIAQKVCMEWGADAGVVKAFMGNYPLLSENEGLLRYGQPEKGITISYALESEKLVASALIYNDLFNMESVSGSMASYNYLGELSGGQVFSNAKKNTVCIAYDLSAGNKEYTVYGFAPIDSESYPELEPIVVTTGGATAIDLYTATVSGSVAGIDSAAPCGFLYGKNQDVNETNSRQFQLSSKGEFQVKLTGLEMNTTYYYCAYTIINGVYYFGSVESFKTKYAQTYKVGDLYPNQQNPIGVVWKVDSDGLHGTIVSLDQGYMKWDVNGAFSSSASCRSAEDGSYNSLPSGQPYGIWVYGHGSGWYGPARRELADLCRALSKVNPTLEANGYKKIQSFYWSSTQYLSDTAYIVCVAESSYMGYSPGWYGYNTKDQMNSVRAMKKF